MATETAPYVPARTAAQLLQIDVRSLYAYVSRGWIRSIAGESSRGRLYSREDIERLRARQRARAGHGPTAAGALRWGEPVLESSITEVRTEGIRYRGHELLSSLVRLPFEHVAELLWSGYLPQGRVEWRPHADLLNADDLKEVRRRIVRYEDPKNRIAVVAASAALRERSGPLTMDSVNDTGRAFYLLIAPLLGKLPPPKAADNSVAATLAAGWSCQAAEASSALNAALIVCADHELNPSTFVARIAASNGARTMSSVEAAVATHCGTGQGLAADDLETLIEQAQRVRRLGDFLASFLTTRGDIPGFGHPLYPNGDPRAPFLMQLAEQLGGRSSRLRTLKRIAEWYQERTNEHPNLDCGLVALSAALNLPAKSASTLYCTGRIAGWLAHILEQRQMNFRIRPRAKYVGDVKG